MSATESGKSVFVSACQSRFNQKATKSASLLELNEHFQFFYLKKGQVDEVEPYVELRVGAFTETLYK